MGSFEARRKPMHEYQMVPTSIYTRDRVDGMGGMTLAELREMAKQEDR